LLADWLLGEGARQGVLPDKPLVVTTIVSTSLTAKVAEAYGARCEETLTGFKWIWDRARKLGEQDGAGFVFGFEEALGYCVGTAVRDKDGIGAAEVLMELAAALKAGGRTLAERLDDLAVSHGLHLTSQVATVLPGLQGRAKLDAVMAKLRGEPPQAIAGSAVARARDLQGGDEAAGLVPADVLTWWLEDGSRVVMRPSGTEPKLKSYLEVAVPVAGGAKGVPAARARAAERLAELEAWVREAVSGRSDAPAGAEAAAAAPAEAAGATAAVAKAAGAKAAPAKAAPGKAAPGAAAPGKAAPGAAAPGKAAPGAAAPGKAAPGAAAPGKAAPGKAAAATPALAAPESAATGTAGAVGAPEPAATRAAGAVAVAAAPATPGATADPAP
jgi:hypothetical protein